MVYENKAFVPQSPAQLKREYLETPFWFSSFPPGSQITIVEDLPRNKPMRFQTKPGKWGTQSVNLVKITDGFISKDLELSKKCAWALFAGLPDSIENLKGCTFANDNGRWVFVSQTAPGMNENMPKSNQIAASMEEAPTEIGNQIRMLHAALQTNQATKIFNSVKIGLDIAEKIRPGDALNLITAAKQQGWIREIIQDGVTGYKAE